MFEPREFELGSVKGLSLRAIQLHLDLYRGYVEQVNQLLKQLREQPADRPPGSIARDARARRLAFEWNGMVLHELFFEALRGPGTEHEKSGVFAEALDQSFGGFDAWRNDLTAMAAMRGVGWVATVRDARTNHAFNVWIDEHHEGMPARVQLLLVVDLWEHAYLLDYAPTHKGAYVQAILGNVDWSLVESRCAAVQEESPVHQCRA